MPRCRAGHVTAAVNAQRAARERAERARAEANGYGGPDTLEMARPPEVRIPLDSGWPEATGSVHHSPGLALRRRCGDGAAFTPINERSEKDLPTDRSVSRYGVCAPVVLLFRCFGKVIDLLNSVAVQTLLYVLFVALFQLMTDTIRLKEEYHFDKFIADTFLENHFDSSHNTFQTIRRVGDIYEWGNNVLIPGLFANAGPCASAVGATAAFVSAADRPTPTNLTHAMLVKGCNDDAWRGD